MGGQDRAYFSYSGGGVQNFAKYAYAILEHLPQACFTCCINESCTRRLIYLISGLSGKANLSYLLLTFYFMNAELIADEISVVQVQSMNAHYQRPLKRFTDCPG